MVVKYIQVLDANSCYIIDFYEYRRIQNKYPLSYAVSI